MRNEGASSDSRMILVGTVMAGRWSATYPERSSSSALATAASSRLVARFRSPAASSILCASSASRSGTNVSNDSMSVRQALASSIASVARPSRSAASTSKREARCSCRAAQRGRLFPSVLAAAMAVRAEEIRRCDDLTPLCRLRSGPYHARHFRAARSQNLSGREKIAVVRESGRVWAWFKVVLASSSLYTSRTGANQQVLMLRDGNDLVTAAPLMNSICEAETPTTVT